MFGLGFTEFLILALVLLLFFGPFKINEVTKSIGQGIRKFKEAKNEIDLTDSRSGQKPDRDPMDKS
jgi:sec-independent protein translocase protein TatA